jgi:hypothetical protein
MRPEPVKDPGEQYLKTSARVATTNQIASLSWPCFRQAGAHKELFGTNLSSQPYFSLYSHLGGGGDVGAARPGARSVDVFAHRRVADPELVEVGEVPGYEPGGTWWRRWLRWGSWWCLTRQGPSRPRSRPGCGRKRLDFQRAGPWVCVCRRSRRGTGDRGRSAVPRGEDALLRRLVRGAGAGATGGRQTGHKVHQPRRQRHRGSRTAGTAR